ncbi:MAG: NAD(P)H-binding protein [Rhodospirillales bacterium]|nr:NAD(P)H-binding protein [Rhodospirillales bacterium]
MYAVTGITGKVGGTLAQALLAQGKPVRAVLRDPAKAEIWAARGCEIALAEMEDAAQLAQAFAGAEGVFILPPPEFDPAPGFPAAKRVINAVAAALRIAKPARVLCLSTIGADARFENLLTPRGMMEEALGALGLPVIFLRSAWFMDNALWDAPAARDEAVLRSFLQPLHKSFPMVAARDVGDCAAGLLMQGWEGSRIVELEGPNRVSPEDLAAAFSQALGHTVKPETVPRAAWEALFTAQGMNHPTPRIRMLDGFNEGWIDFRGGHETAQGKTPLAEVIAALVKTST